MEWGVWTIHYHSYQLRFSSKQIRTRVRKWRIVALFVELVFRVTDCVNY